MNRIKGANQGRLRLGSRIVSMILSIAMMLGMLPMSVFATSDMNTNADETLYIEDGDISIFVDDLGYVTYTQGEMTGKYENIILSSRDFSQSSANKIAVTTNANKKISATIKNLNIDVSESSGAAFTVYGNGELAIELSGENTLTSASRMAGLEVCSSATLVINDVDGDAADGIGGLIAEGGGYGAGIGSSSGNDNGTIIINSGRVTGIGGFNSAGIGGGKEGSAGLIIINGGSVSAGCHWYGSGIGSGGYNDNGGRIIINDGVITASSSVHGAGIGGAQGGFVDEIIITGGTITSTGTGWEAGIGDGSNKTGSIVILGGSVSVRGGDFDVGAKTGAINVSSIIGRNEDSSFTAEKHIHTFNRITDDIPASCQNPRTIKFVCLSDECPQSGETIEYIIGETEEHVFVRDPERDIKPTVSNIGLEAYSCLFCTATDDKEIEYVFNPVSGNKYAQSTMLCYGPNVIPEDILSEGITPPYLNFTTETDGVFHVVETEGECDVRFAYTINNKIITIVPNPNETYPAMYFGGKTALYMEIQDDGNLKVIDFTPNNGSELGWTSRGDIFTLKTNEDTHPTIESFTLNGESESVTVEVGEPLTLGGIINGNGSNLKAVSVAIRLQSDETKGGEWHTGRDASGNVINQNIASFELSDFNDTVVTAGEAFGNMEALNPGTYVVQVYATNQNDEGFAQVHTINLTIVEKEMENPVSGNTYVQSTLVAYNYDTIPEDFFSEGINPPSLKFTSVTEGVFYIVNSEEAYNASFNYTIDNNIITIVPNADGSYPAQSFGGKTALYMEIQDDGSLKVSDFTPDNGSELGFTVRGDIFTLKTNEDIRPTIENFTLNNQSESVTVEVGEQLTLGGIVKGNGSNLKAVSVAIRLQSDETKGGEWHTGKDANGEAINQNIESFDLSDFNDTVVIAGEEFGNTTLTPGTYIVQAYATNQSGNGFAGVNRITMTIVEKQVEGDGGFLLGDVNSDGVVTVEDAAVLKNYLADSNVNSNININVDAADINCDGVIDNEDYTLLRNYLSGMTGNENIYDSILNNNMPTITGVNNKYEVIADNSLQIEFTVKAAQNGHLKKITLKHNQADTTFESISYDCSEQSYTGKFELSGYPFTAEGTYEFVIYCSASNYDTSNNAIFAFSVDVKSAVCEHPYEYQNDIWKSTVYTDLLKNESEHTYYHVYSRTCGKCKMTIETVNAEPITEPHAINKKGYCACGYIDITDYNSWIGYNTSDGNTTVFINPESKSWYGKLYSNEQVKVLGESCGRYLVEYFTNGSSKQGYVAKEQIYRAFNYNDTLIMLNDIIGSSKLYAEAEKLMDAVNGTYNQIASDKANLVCYRTNDLDSAIVISLDLSNAKDWDGITAEVKGLDNKVIDYILATKLNEKLYIDVEKYLSIVNNGTYNVERTDQIKNWLGDYYESFLSADEKTFQIDNPIKEILLRGGISLLIDEVKGIIDMTGEDELPDGEDIVNTMILTLVREKEDDTIEEAVQAHEAINYFINQFEKLKKLTDGKDVDEFADNFSKIIEAIVWMSEEEYLACRGAEVLGDGQNQTLQKFLTNYGFKATKWDSSIEIVYKEMDIETFVNIRKYGTVFYDICGSLNFATLIFKPLLEGSQIYGALNTVAQNFKGDIRTEIVRLYETTDNNRLKNNLSDMIEQIDNGTYDSIWNIYDPADVGGGIITNVDEIRNAYNFSLHLSKKGFFGSKIANKVKDMSKLEFNQMIKGILAADTILSLPSFIMSFAGYDTAQMHELSTRIITITELLNPEVNTFKKTPVNINGHLNDEFINAYKNCNLFSNTLIEYYMSFAETFPEKDAKSLKESFTQSRKWLTETTAEFNNLIGLE